ncbi:MAG: SRPBCC family protein [Chloroflexi bacterium]|nr:SRPBCC family protein [Chloroflexota bacterium]
MGRIREDVHIHASASETFERLEATARYAEWLPGSFRDVEGESGAHARLEGVLTLPLRSERVSLEVAEREPSRLLLFRSTDGARGAFETLSWVLTAEGAEDVHLLVEAIYTPAGGFAGWLLDLLVQRQHRRQALRDAVWRLKQLLEGAGPAAQPGDGDGSA